MQRIFKAIKSNPLFEGIAIDAFERILGCLSARTAAFGKDDVVLLAGDAVNFVGVVLSGGVRVVREDIDGRATILAELGAPETFAEVFACAGVSQSPVTVLAAEKTEILFLGYKRLVMSCGEACTFHARLIENMLRLIAQKNLMLNQKLEILSKRTTREKLLCFFDIQRGDAKSFAIPFNREELARYLCVDRSAMSGELCKMRDERLIRFRKNAFELL